MQQLTNAEEQLMEHLWKLEKAFYERFTRSIHSKPKTTTQPLCFKKRMIDKDFVFYRILKPREYYPLVENSLFSKHVNGLIKNFFNDSASHFAFSLPMRPTYRKRN
jgi:predicted transcriptional regulator